MTYFFLLFSLVLVMFLCFSIFLAFWSQPTLSQIQNSVLSFTGHRGKCDIRVILTAISDTFVKLTYCHFALLYSLLPKEFLFLNFNHFKDFVNKLPLEYQIVTKTYLHLTYILMRQ